jgi:hypothetical protein
MAVVLALSGCSASPPDPPVAHLVIPDELRTCQAARRPPAILPALVTAERLRRYAEAERWAIAGDEAALRDCAQKLSELIGMLEEREANASASPAKAPRP